MSACSNFTPGAWKKDQCCECFRKKDEHATNSIPTISVTRTSSNISHLFMGQESSTPVSFVKAISEKQKQIFSGSNEPTSILKSAERKAMGASDPVKGTHRRAIVKYFIKESTLSNLRTLVSHEVYDTILVCILHY